MRCSVRHRLAIDNMRDIGDHPITPVYRRVEHAPRGIATDRERDGDHPIWYTLMLSDRVFAPGSVWESSYHSHKNDSGKAPQTLHEPTLLLHGNSTHRHLPSSPHALSEAQAVHMRLVPESPCLSQYYSIKWSIPAFAITTWISSSHFPSYHPMTRRQPPSDDPT